MHAQTDPNDAGSRTSLTYAAPDPHRAPPLLRVACSEAAARCPKYAVESSLRRADALALSLAAGLHRVTPALARTAAAIVDRKTWFEFGYARLDDFARERLDGSGRWVRDLAILGRKLNELPELESALRGEDGGRPLCQVEALDIARIATSGSVTAWIDLARRTDLGRLRDAIRAARESGSDRPSDEAASCFVPTAAGGAAARGDTPDGPGRSERDDDRAKRTGSAWPDGPASRAAAGGRGADPESETSRHLVRFMVPQPVLAAFDEAVDLFRAVNGSESTVTSFVEALVGEAFAGSDPPELDPDADRRALDHGKRQGLVEAALASSTNHWEHLPKRSDGSWALALSGTTLERLVELEARAGRGNAGDLEASMVALGGLEDEIRRRLGRLLAEMGAMGGWSRLRFSGAGHYAEQRLGLSRGMAEDRLRVFRALGPYPVLRKGYEQGRLRLESVKRILAILGRRPASDAVQRRWLEHAVCVTVRRMRDESLALACREAGADGDAPGRPSEGRSGVGHHFDSPDFQGHPETAETRSSTEPSDSLGAPAPFESKAAPESPIPSGSRACLNPMDPPEPCSDAAWRASLRREPGRSRRRIFRLGQRAAGSPMLDVFLRLRLPGELAAAWMSCVESARRRLARLAGSVPWDQDWPDPEAPPSIVAARHFFVRCRRVPTWVGLLAMLEDFAVTWDDPRAMPRRPDREIHFRDGYRCTAPGCTSRARLQVHHSDYRSHGGCEEAWNKMLLCLFHHLQGEHGGLSRCRGRAPLGIVWRLGRADLAAWFRNDRRVPAPR